MFRFTSRMFFTRVIFSPEISGESWKTKGGLGAFLFHSAISNSHRTLPHSLWPLRSSNPDPLPRGLAGLVWCPWLDLAIGDGAERAWGSTEPISGDAAR